MRPVVTPEEMAGVDRAAPEPVSALIERAGASAARVAAGMLAARGGIAGRRVVVVAGKGHNGDDGRAAAARLRRRGVAVLVLDAAGLAGGASLPRADLVIDAAYGTGLGRAYHPPDPGAAPVLAVDIPSGLSGLTGTPEGSGGGGAVRAAATVTFGALKPGLLLGDGPTHSGAVEVAGIGLDRLAAAVASIWLVGDADVAAALPPRGHDAHKWQSALQVVAGSPGMTGAPWLASRAAMRAGAGYVRLGMPGVAASAAGFPPGELVHRPLPTSGWVPAVLEDIERFAALVVGPGLGSAGRGEEDQRGMSSPAGELLAGAPDIPAVVDADGLAALGDLDAVAALTARRRAPIVLTPHDGEFARLVGSPPGPDRIGAARRAAARAGAVVLLKGGCTVVADPGGEVLLAAAGGPRLATAGTGDVLSGVIGALLARGVDALEAAAFGAHVHGRASALGWREGLVASDLPELIARWLSSVMGGGTG